MVEGLTVEELARLKEYVDRRRFYDRPADGSSDDRCYTTILALITQVERLTAERDEARRIMRQKIVAIYALEDLSKEHSDRANAAEARADTLAAENGKLRETLENMRALAHELRYMALAALTTFAVEEPEPGTALAAGEPAR